MISDSLLDFFMTAELALRKDANSARGTRFCQRHPTIPCLEQLSLVAANGTERQSLHLFCRHLPLYATPRSS